MQISLRPNDPFEVRRTLVVSNAADAATVAAALGDGLVRRGYRTERPQEGVLAFSFGGVGAWARKNGQADAPFTRGCIAVATAPTGEVVLDLTLRFDSRFVMGYILASMLIAMGLLPSWPMRLGMVLVFVGLFHQARAAMTQSFIREIARIAPVDCLEPSPRPAGPALPPADG